MKSAMIPAVLVAALASGGAMADTIVQSYVGVGIYARDCSVSPGCTPGTEDTGPLPPLVDGVSQAMSTTGSVSLLPASDPYDFPDLGLVSNTSGQQSFATASNNGPFALPTLDSALYSQDSRVSVGADALESYTWDGTGPATRTIGGSLTLSESGGWPANGGSTASVGLVVFTTGSSSADFVCGDLTYANGGNLCVANATVLAQSFMTMTGAMSDQTINLDLPAFQLSQPGETIFVLASTDFFGNGGGYVTDPFTTTISDATGLTPANVPEPDSLALFGAGLLGLGWLLRRRRRNA